MSTPQRPVRIGTRGSLLARAQASLVAEWVGRALAAPVELVEISTEGDRNRAALAQIGGQGVFVGAVREALAVGECDLAVHSLKDLPTTDHPRVRLCAVPPREDPRDVLVARDGHTLATLPPGSRIGTGSARRAAQLLALGKDFTVVPVRGNVDTRLRLVADGAVDGVVLALAGLVRLGRAAEATEVIDPSVMLPSPGQGALAVEVAVGSPLGDRLEAELDDAPTRHAVTAERALLTALGVGCSSPVGALAVRDTGRSEAEAVLRLDAVVAWPDGSRVTRESAEGPPGDAEELGRRVAAQLSAAAAEVLAGATP